jgi:hypothetical protein
MSKQSQSGRISPKIRVAIVEAVREFATAKNLPFNTVMSAVLWAGTKMEERMSASNLKELINPETVLAYQAEVQRRQDYFNMQLEGIITNALPKAFRLPANIAGLTAKAPKGKSLPALKVWATATVATEFATATA